MNTSRTISPWLRALPLAASLLLLAGCSALSNQQRDPVTIYAPLVQITPDPNWPKVDWQLAVLSPTASRVVDSPRISVRPVPGEIQIYRGVSWSQPSTGMIEDLVLNALEDSGKIRSVARPASGIRADYRLVLDLRRFDSDYAGGTLPSAVVELNAKLLQSSDQRVVASRTFLVSKPATSTAIPQVVQAFEQSLQVLGQEVVGWTLTEGEADARRKR